MPSARAYKEGEQHNKQHSVDRASNKSTKYTLPAPSPPSVVRIDSRICVLAVVFDADMSDNSGAAQANELREKAKLVPEHLVLRCTHDESLRTVHLDEL